MNEFSLINHFFTRSYHPPVVVGVGDDAAVVQFPEDCATVMTMDTLNEEIHFFKESSPFDVAYKAVTVNVSDLCAMGATPSVYCLSLTLPSVDSTWLQAFNEGLLLAEKDYGIQLIGGDTTKGPLAISIQATGLYPKHKKLVLRSGAKVGDSIFVTGELGEPSYALTKLLKSRALIHERPSYAEKLLKPSAKIDYISLIRQFATSAIDISDGLTQDLNHILYQSGVGAILYKSELPVTRYMMEEVPPDKRDDFALTGGDEYELCLTISQNNVESFLKAIKEQALSIFCIGEIVSGEGLMLSSEDKIFSYDYKGWQHFD